MNVTKCTLYFQVDSILDVFLRKAPASTLSALFHDLVKIIWGVFSIAGDAGFEIKFLNLLIFDRAYPVQNLLTNNGVAKLLPLRGHSQLERPKGWGKSSLSIALWCRS